MSIDLIEIKVRLLEVKSKKRQLTDVLLNIRLKRTKAMGLALLIHLAKEFQHKFKRLV